MTGVVMKTTELQTLLQSLQHNLNILREREAKFGIHTPLDLVNQIEDHQTAIRLVNAAIKGEITSETLEAELAPLNLSLRGDTEILAGRNIIKIGNITVPAFPLIIATLVILSLSAIAVWYFVVPDKMPLNTFNIAVAEFGREDADGKVTPFEDGAKLSEWMFGKMRAEYESWPQNRPVVWHDSMGFLQKRGRIGIITGDTPVKRHENAEKLAKRLGAQMLIYGNIAGDESAPHFIPEFYIADIENEADELVGTYQLGEPIAIRLPLDLYDQRANSFFEQNLGVRADVLVWFTRGLALDLSGRHTDALAVFRDAATAEELKSWSNPQGREILEYFMGRQALFLGLDDPSYLDEAESAFKTALAINPDYSRAHIGLGGVYFQRVQHHHLQTASLPAGVSPETELNLAIDEFRQAVEQSGITPDPQVALKGILSLGFAYGLLGEIYLNNGDIPRATEAYAQSVANTEQAITRLSDSQHRLLAQAYLNLGATHEGQAYAVQAEDPFTAKSLYKAAQSAYDNCIRQADAEFYDTTLQKIKTVYCLPYREAVQTTLNGL